MVLTKTLIIHIMVYAAITIITLLLVFSIVRTIAQMIFIRECPRCKKRVSLIKTKLCPKCNYDFQQDSDPKHVWLMFFLILAVIGLIAADVYTFKSHMQQYQKNNPYENVDSITTQEKSGTQSQSTQTPSTQSQ